MSRFPYTAAALEQEAEALAEGLLAVESFRLAIERHVMASVSELKQVIEATKASVDELTARVGQAQSGGIDPKDLDPVLDEVNTLRSTVEALASSLEKPADASGAAQTADNSGTAIGGTAGSATAQDASAGSIPTVTN
jgi:hypothetical protein